MAETVIQVEQLSKLYRLGTIGTGSLRQDLQRWWNMSVLRREDPFFQLQGTETAAAHNQFLWALQDVSFEVEQGHALGIIGSNGSGKSTLLKIISRIVKPTKGTVRGKGKISSLLEVGTGFHHELTGRENIYISGYTLGMDKQEIRSKFDEIVAFSGIEKFIDTPVKRYSSGMYVRLAFAVAAHLEPDILIVDEVLAVGDADFQQKCLGKMQKVSQSDGRTIIFVSHSMQAINNLCDKAVWLNKGIMKESGRASDVINKYVANIQKLNIKQVWDNPETAPGNNYVRFKRVELIPHKNNSEDPLDIRTPLTIQFEFWNLSDSIVLSSGLILNSYKGECIFDIPAPDVRCHKGIVSGECHIPGNFLNDGSYYISITIVKDKAVGIYNFEECLSFEIEDYRPDLNWYGKWKGVVRPNFPFVLTPSKSFVDETYNV